jgi:C4-dicarboxylate-specific signal transduction histidine kinase
MEMHALQDWTFDSLMVSVHHIPPGTIVIFSSFRRDQRGQQFNSGDLIASLTRAASAPVYGLARNWLGDGVVGGAMMQFADDGTRTARLLLRVLRRAPGQPMPPPELAAIPQVVDWRQMERWGLPENRLPKGTQVLFRTPSVWERYRCEIVGVIGILTVESLLIGLLLLERKRRMGAQRAVEEQVAYERMIAALTADTLRLSPVELFRGLEAALCRVGRFAGATSALLIVDPDDDSSSPTRLSWADAERRVPVTPRAPDLSSNVGSSNCRSIRLVSGNAKYGVLELYRPSGSAWPAVLEVRLQAAADLIAGGLSRARAGRALAESRRQVEHMARVATVSGLAAAVSHELRQPLAAIRANAEAGALLLARTPPDVHETRVILHDIVRDGVRASQVIDHFRALLRKQEPTRTTIDLNDVCRDTAQLMEHEARARRAKLAVSLQPNLPSVRGDAVQLQQVVINLTLNALDSVSVCAQDRYVVLGTTVSNGEVEVYVRDNGPGLQPDAMHRLFEPFFSTKPRGLGMGLTIVRTIVERHEGRLRVENCLTGGALFRVGLPAIEAEPPSSDTRPLAPAFATAAGVSQIP